MTDTFDHLFGEAWDATTSDPANPTPDSDAAATTADPVEATTGTPESQPGDPTDAVAAANPAPTTPAAEATPANREAPAIDATSKALIDEVTAEHPELAAALTAKVKELERGYQRRFQRLADERKEIAEQVVRDHTISQVPVPHLQQIARAYTMAQTGTKAEKEAAANFLFEMSEAVRQDALNAPADPYSGLPPQVAEELGQMRQYVQSQTQQQIAAQVAGEWTKIQTEFGTTVPEDQKNQVYEVMNARGLTQVEDLGMVWRGLFGWQHAKQEGLKRGQELRATKQGLSAGGTAAPQPAAASTPKGFWDELDAICKS